MTAPARLASRRVFVDTSAYFALVDDTEADHSEAVAILGRLADARYRQYTTNVVLIECHALMLARLGRARAGQFLRSMATSHTTIVRARAQDEDRAKAILARYNDKDFSFADTISFVVMQRLGITRAFTLDDHFAQFGFTVLTSRTAL